MSTHPQHSERDRFAIALKREVLEARLFGALNSAALYFKRHGLSRREVAMKAGMDETALSRFFVRPSNFKLSTLAAILHSFELEIEFILKSKADPRLKFTDTGAVVDSYDNKNAVGPDASNVAKSIVAQRAGSGSLRANNYGEYQWASKRDLERV